MNETIQTENQLKTLRINNKFFVDFLLQQKVNFLFSTPPYGEKTDFKKDLIKNKYIEYNPTENNLYGYYFNNGWTITEETNGFINDSHAGLHGNLQIAKRILEKINKIYDYEYIEYRYDDKFNNTLI
jgi:endo-beta-N-acetylglucosaminidase D